MNKYFLFFKNSIVESLVYRANIFLLFFSQLTSLGIYIFLWWAIYEQGGAVEEYSLNNLVVYYLISTFIGFVIQGVDVAWQVGDEINSGSVTGFLLQPISYVARTFSVVMGKTTFNFSLMIGLFLIFALFQFDLVWLGITDWERNGFFLIALLLALGIHFFLFFLVGVLTFWLGLVQGLNFSMRMVMFFFAGNMIPLNLLPNFLEQLIGWLPFKYIVWMPIQIFQRAVELEWTIFLPGLVWLMGLYFLTRFVFKKGIEKYEGFGA